MQQLDGFLYRPGAGVRPEIAVLLVHGAPVVRHARENLPRRSARSRGGAGDLEIGVAFIVPEKNVELGAQRLDEVVFQQQRLCFGAHHGRLHAHDLANHVAGACTTMVLLKIAGHPPLEVERLAHVKQRALRVEIAVDARQRRQSSHLRQKFFRMHIRHGAYCGAMSDGLSNGYHRMLAGHILKNVSRSWPGPRSHRRLSGSSPRRPLHPPQGGVYQCRRDHQAHAVHQGNQEPVGGPRGIRESRR